jgi:hypothetical protein
MAMIYLKRGPVRIGESWFQEEPSRRVDIARYIHLDRCIPGARCTSVHTIVTDLMPDSDSLLAAMKPQTRTGIRRAARDGVRTNLWFSPGDAVMHAFRRFFVNFARQKNLSLWNEERFCALRQNGMLTISNAVTPSGDALVWHSYVHYGQTVLELHSASQFRSSQLSAERNAIGRANRYLHFHDMLAFKDLDFRVFAFGGWYAGSKDVEKLRINKFKEGFGGQVVRHFTCELGVTSLGKCALLLNQVRHSLLAGRR